MRIKSFSEARGIFESEEFSLEPHIYCFGGGGGGGEGSGSDGYSDLGDTGDTGVSESVAAGGQGWGPDNGSNDQSSNDDQDRRVQSNGSTTNVNIDRSQPSVVADVNGTQRTVYGTQENLDAAVASGDLSPVGNVQDNYTPGTREAAEAYSAVIEDKEDALGFDDLDAIAASFDAMDAEDQSMTAGYPTEELQASIGSSVISSLLGDADVPPEQIADIYSSLLNTATKAEQMYSPAQPNYVETDIYGYDYPSYSTPSQQIGSTASEDPSDESTVDFDPGFYDDDTGDTGLSGFISKAFDENNLAVKNNNPGNLKFANQPGATADARGFAKFDDPQAGMDALVDQINLDRSRGDTLEEFISDYAPPSENATQNYIDYVSERTGIAPGEQIPADKVDAVADAITQMEGGELSTDYFSSAQSMYDTMQGDGAGVTVEFVDEGTTDYRDTFVAQDRIGTGFPVTALPEGSYQLDPETSTVALNDAGKEYMDELAKGYNDLPNKYGIDRQEIESLMAQGELVGAPVVNIAATGFSFVDKKEGGEAPAGKGEDEAGLAGGMGGRGRLGDADVTQEGVDNDFAYELPAYFPSETGEYAQGETRTSGLGISPDEGGVGLIPGDGGIIGTDTGLIGQRGSGSINPFTEGGGGGEGEDTSTLPDVGQGDVGRGEGAGGSGTGVQQEVADSGDGGDGGDGTTTPVVEEPVIPYFFGEPMETYDPNLPPFEYRTPLVTTPYDFARDFGSYTLSEPIAQSYAERALLAPEGLVPYTPEYMEPISEMDLARQEELLSLIGERFPGEFGEFEYDLNTSPLESAQALIDALGNQSS